MSSAVYSYNTCNKTTDGTRLVSLHESLELARRWAKYYCQAENGGFMEVTKRATDANGLRPHTFTVAYEGYGYRGLGFFAEEVVSTIVSGSPPDIEYYDLKDE
jgi:hypothetical protein